jgi:hypothetical protein
MIFFSTALQLIKKFSLLFFLTFSFSIISIGQGTVLNPGDIMVLQIDEDEQGVNFDNFIFVTFVEIVVFFLALVLSPTQQLQQQEV